MAQIFDAAIEGNIKDALVTHFKLALRVAHANGVNIIGGRRVQTLANRPRHMLPAASAKAKEALDPAGKILAFPNGSTRVRQPVWRILRRNVARITLQFHQDVQKKPVPINPFPWRLRQIVGPVIESPQEPRFHLIHHGKFSRLPERPPQKIACPQVIKRISREGDIRQLHSFREIGLNAMAIGRPH